MEKSESDLQKDNEVIPRPGAPLPLSYESPRDRPRPQGWPRAFQLVGGFIFGFFVPAVLSGFWFMGINGIEGTTAWQRRVDHAMGAVYLIIAVVLGVLVILRLREPEWRALGLWIPLGALLGAGVAMLMEGICFSVQ